MNAPTLAIGTILAGRYTVHALLGRRAGRATYHCITAPNRHVAVKLLDPALANGEAQAALAMAAAAAAELPEGAVLPVVDRGVDPETGAPFFVSPLSDHPSLEAFVSLCPLSLQEMATMARSLARGLDAAHRRGLAHLALRPTNIFVGPPPVCWTRVADFGAGAVDRVLGLGEDRETLAFAAPELYAAPAAPLTADGAARADVFSAALLCFYAATGDTYWKATRRKGGAPASAGVLPLIQEATGVRAPASVAARDIGAAWNPALDAAFARALSSAPSARFASIGELADALADALQLPRRGGAAGLADSLVRGEPAPRTMGGDDDDDEPATRAFAVPPPRSLDAPEAAPSIAPPPESIAPTGPRTTASHARPGLGGTMILDAGPTTTPAPALVSRVPPPAAVPAFGPSAAPGPLPSPHPSGRPPAAAIEVDVATAPTRSRAPLVIGGAVVAVLGIGIAFAALRGAGEPDGKLLGAATSSVTAPASTPPRASAPAEAPSPAAASSSGPVAAPPAKTTAPDQAAGPEAPEASASAAASAGASPPASASPSDPPPEGPIPTTYGLQPKPRVEQLDPPTTWYAELIVHCEPRCDLVLVQGGPTSNPEIPKQVPPGVYTVTVRQSGGVQSQGTVLRAATRTTLTFDGRLAIPEAR